MRISDWSSDVCSSDLIERLEAVAHDAFGRAGEAVEVIAVVDVDDVGEFGACRAGAERGDADIVRRHLLVKRFGEGQDERLGGIIDSHRRPARTRVVWGKSVSVRVDLGGRRSINKNRARS